MTDEMLALARENQRKAGVESVEFLSGQGLDVDVLAPLVDGRFFGGSIRARKPAGDPQVM